MRRLPMRLPFDVDRGATALVVLLTVATLVAAGAVVVMKTAALDLHRQIEILVQAAPPNSRSPVGQAASALLARDIAPDDHAALDVRTNQLDHRGDRLLEATAVVALVGMLIALLVTPPASAARRAREQRMRLAQTAATASEGSARRDAPGDRDLAQGNVRSARRG